MRGGAPLEGACLAPRSCVAARCHRCCCCCARFSVFYVSSTATNRASRTPDQRSLALHCRQTAPPARPAPGSPLHHPTATPSPPLPPPLRSDLTFDQFASKMLMSGVSVADVQARAASGTPFVPPSRRNGRKLAQAVPNEFDWRSSGKVPPPRDQGGCGRWERRGRDAQPGNARSEGLDCAYATPLGPQRRVCTLCCGVEGCF